MPNASACLRQLLGAGLLRSRPPSRETAPRKLRKLLENKPTQSTDTMKSLHIFLFGLAAVVSTAGTVAVGRSLAADPTSDSAHSQAVALVAMAALAGASTMCAAAAATDN